MKKSELKSLIREVIVEAESSWPKRPIPTFKIEIKNGIEYLNGKEIDQRAFEVGGVDSGDYPDFSDAFLEAGYYADGSPMTDEELEFYEEKHPGLAHELATDSLHENQNIKTMKKSQLKQLIREVLEGVGDYQFREPKIQKPNIPLTLTYAQAEALEAILQNIEPEKVTPEIDAILNLVVNKLKR